MVYSHPYNHLTPQINSTQVITWPPHRKMLSIVHVPLVPLYSNVSGQSLDLYFGTHDPRANLQFLALKGTYPNSSHTHTHIQSPSYTSHATCLTRWGRSPCHTI